MDYFEDEVVGDAAIKRISSLAKEQVELEDAVDHIAAQLEEKKAELDLVAKTLLPDAMKECGMESFTLDTGEAISIKKTIKGNISDRNKSAAHQWLRDNGHGDIIKNEVTVSFGAGEDHEASVFLSSCSEEGRNVKQKERVHTQTLGAFIREQKADGNNLPDILLGTMEFLQARIKRGR